MKMLNVISVNFSIEMEMRLDNNLGTFSLMFFKLSNVSFISVNLKVS